MSVSEQVSSSYDVVIAGARCAGAATALLLARQGLQVLVIDRSRRGTDTLSTHALMRGGVLQLHRWGLLPAVKAAGTPAVRTTAFHYGDEVVEIPIKPQGGMDGLYAPRRTVLDPILADAAADAGATFAYGTRLMDLMRTSDGRVCGVVVQRRDRPIERIGARIVVGADGAHSTVARLVGAGAYRQGRHAGGVVYGYVSGLPSDAYHWYYRPGVSAGVIPTNGEQACVFTITTADRFLAEIRFDMAAGFLNVLREVSPELRSAVDAAAVAGVLRGFPGQAGYWRQSWGPGWALVGDAGYFKDPITAHGITDALRDAEMLARAIATDSEAALAGYQSTRDRLSAGLFDVTDRIASFAWDLPTLKEWHLYMSDEMRREVRWLTDLDEWPAVA